MSSHLSSLKFETLFILQEIMNFFGFEFHESHQQEFFFSKFFSRNQIQELETNPWWKVDFDEGQKTGFKAVPKFSKYFSRQIIEWSLALVVSSLPSHRSSFLVIHKFILTQLKRSLSTKGNKHCRTYTDFADYWREKRANAAHVL
jgi:hypothetical protein